MHIDSIVQALLDGGLPALGMMGWAAWWYERRQNKDNADHLLKLATAQIEATVKHGVAIEANTKIMERWLER